MKKIVALIYLFCSISLLAADPELFKETYPDSQYFQQILFNEIRTYFESLPINSLKYIDANGTIIFKIPKENGYTTIYAKIQRSEGENQIKEHVSYILENGKSLTYEVIKKGAGVTFSEDFDLLTFKFKRSEKDQFYQIVIPTYNIQITHEKNSEEKSLFLLGFMEFNIEVNSFFKAHEASLHYLFFSLNIPTPQASLTVRAIESESEWNAVEYYHISSQAGGTISPGEFFKALNDVAGVFADGAQGMFHIMLYRLGFPKLN